MAGPGRTIPPPFPLLFLSLPTHMDEFYGYRGERGEEKWRGRESKECAEMGELA